MLNSDGNKNGKKGVLSKKKKKKTFHGRTDGWSCDCQIFWHLLVTWLPFFTHQVCSATRALRAAQEAPYEEIYRAQPPS